MSLGDFQLLTSDSTLNVFICLLEYHALLLGAINVIVYWTGKKEWGVCVCLLGIQSSRRIMPGDEAELIAGDDEPETLKIFGYPRKKVRSSFLIFCKTHLKFKTFFSECNVME